MTRDEYVAATNSANQSYIARAGSDLENAHAVDDAGLIRIIEAQKRANIEQFAEYQRSWVDRWVASNTTGDRRTNETVYLTLAAENARLELQMRLEALHREYTGS